MMKNLSTRRSMVFVFFVMSFNVFGQTTDTSKSVIKSALTGIDLPTGAAAVKESDLPEEVKANLNKITASISEQLSATGTKVEYETGDLEAASWTKSEKDKTKWNLLLKKIETELKAAGWKYEPAKEKASEPILFSLSRTEPKPRLLAGLFLVKDNSLTLVLTELVKKKEESALSASMANLTGKWNMICQAAGLTIPVTLELKPDGETLGGTFSSHAGNGTIRNIRVSGNKLEGTAKVEFKAQNKLQTVDLILDGIVEGDKMSGTLNGKGLPEISFTATKAN